MSDVLCTFHYHYPDEMYTHSFLINKIMKYIILLFLLIFTPLQAHNQNVLQQLNTCNETVRQNAYWAQSETNSSVMLFCYGFDLITQKPVCAKIPDQYIVIKVPKKLQ